MELNEAIRRAKAGEAPQPFAAQVAEQCEAGKLDLATALHVIAILLAHEVG